MSRLEADMIEAAWANDELLRQRCRTLASIQNTDPAECGSDRARPDIELGPGELPDISPESAALVAIAQLRLPIDPPGIGPSPESNQWKMAAVGYPLWLWLEGPSRLGPVSQSVGGLSVSLDAQVDSVRFHTGDGATVSCSVFDRRWSKAADTGGVPSPVCGHRYAKPSLPSGSYRVVAVADWAVTWRANGESGVVHVLVAGSTQLPVGELQVLVR